MIIFIKAIVSIIIVIYYIIYTFSRFSSVAYLESVIAFWYFRSIWVHVRSISIPSHFYIFSKGFPWCWKNVISL